MDRLEADLWTCSVLCKAPRVEIHLLLLDAYPRSRLMPNEGGFLLREGAEVLVLTATGECILAS